MRLIRGAVVATVKELSYKTDTAARENDNTLASTLGLLLPLRPKNGDSSSPLTKYHSTVDVYVQLERLS